MKKTKCLIVLMVAGLLTVLASCKGNATHSGGGSKNTKPIGGGDLALNGITINGTLFENTSEVYVMKNTVTVNGKQNMVE
ncbi:MAG: hypothetical protein IKX23_10710 [Treponema sp.]|nr:hypothetical protein [Treponema sp.]